MTLTQEGREVALEICNEGGGRVVPPLDPPHRGMGHHGMRYRAGLIGAQYTSGATETVAVSPPPTG